MVPFGSLDLGFRSLALRVQSLGFRVSCVPRYSGWSTKCERHPKYSNHHYWPWIGWCKIS